MESISRNIPLTGGFGIALVLDGEERLVGVVTDGDIRRSLLQGSTLETRLDAAMNANPVAGEPGDNYHRLLRRFERGVRHIPITDKEGHVVDLVLYKDLAPPPRVAGRVQRAKVPMRISFAGGGTDLTSVFENRGGAVISATIDRYCYADVIVREDRQIRIRSNDTGEEVTFSLDEQVPYNGTLDLLKASVRVSRPQFGFELYVSSDVPPGSGLGGSSAMSVAVIGLLDYMSCGRIEPYRIADLAFQAERVELGIPGGWQDQYATVFGGLNLVEFDEHGVFVHPLRLTDSVRHELEHNLVLCFTGDTRNSGDIHGSIEREDSGAYQMDGPTHSSMLDLVSRVKRSLLTGELLEFGRLLDEAWQLKKGLNDSISTGKADELYDLAKDHGALGGKLLGAGGGGFLLFYCAPLKKHRVQKALADVGAHPVSPGLDMQGLRIWDGQTERSV